MSANLSNSATLVASPAFRGLVEAAIREYAIATLADREGTLENMWLRHAMARSVIHDAGSYVEKFAGIIADDATVSTTADPAAVDVARVRAVVEGVWASVAASTPGVG